MYKIIPTALLATAVTVAAPGVTGDNGDPNVSWPETVEGLHSSPHHPGMGQSPVILQYQHAYEWIHEKWTGTSQPVNIVPDTDYQAAVERAIAPEVFARIEAVLRAGGDLDSVRRTLSTAHYVLDWNPDWIPSDSGQFPESGYYLRDGWRVPVRQVRLTVTEAMAVRLIGKACFDPMDTYLRRPLELDRSLSMAPEGRLSTRYQPETGEARAVLTPAYTRCMEFISKDGQYLPDGTSLESVVEQRVSDHIGRVLDPAE